MLRLKLACATLYYIAGFAVLSGFAVLTSCTVDEGTKEKSPEAVEIKTPSLAIFGWNAFASGSVQLTESGLSGRLAALGMVELTDFAVGHALPDDANRCDIATLGSLTLTRGQVGHGRLCVAGELQSQDVGAPFSGTNVVGLRARTRYAASDGEFVPFYYLEYFRLPDIDFHMNALIGIQHTL
jgi:hypothetical protein